MTDPDPNEPSEDEEAPQSDAEAEAETEDAELTDEELEASTGGTFLRINKTTSPVVSPGAVMMEAAEIDELTSSQLLNKTRK